MYIANIRTFISESFFLPDFLGDIILYLFEKCLHIGHLLTDPCTRYIVHIRVYGHDLLSFIRKMLDLRTRKRETTILIFRLPEEEYSIAFCEFRQYKSLIEPYCLSVHTITIRDDCLDEKLLVPRHLTREELDRSFDDLLLLDIQEGEFRIYFTLILVVSGIESDKIPHSFYTCFFQFLNIHIGGMEE